MTTSERIPQTAYFNTIKEWGWLQYFIRVSYCLCFCALFPVNKSSLCSGLDLRCVYFELFDLISGHGWRRINPASLCSAPLVPPHKFIGCGVICAVRGRSVQELWPRMMVGVCVGGRGGQEQQQHRNLSVWPEILHPQVAVCYQQTACKTDVQTGWECTAQ